VLLFDIVSFTGAVGAVNVKVGVIIMLMTMHMHFAALDIPEDLRSQKH
jgi:hypothetical protein